MSITLAQVPASRLLTTVDRVKSEAVISGSGNDAFLSELVEQASDLIESWAGRPLYRAEWLQVRGGTGTAKLDLWRYPIVSLETASYLGNAVTDVELLEPSVGVLYRYAGFTTVASPSEWSFNFTAGWVVPASNLLLASISVTSADDAYNGVFPEGLRPGDYIVASGFTNSGNNGTKVIGTASTTKLQVVSSLTEEAEGLRNLRLHNLPGWIERVAIDLVKTAYTERTASEGLKSIEVGDASMSWSETAQSTFDKSSRKVAALARLNF